jgi:hypothetical protein
LKNNYDLNVPNYWSRCTDPYNGGIEFEAFGKKSNLDNVYNHCGYNRSNILLVFYVIVFVNGSFGQVFQGL